MSESSYLPKTLTTPPKTPPPPPSSSIPSEDSLDYSLCCGLELDPSGQILNLNNSSPPPKSPPNLLPHLAQSSSAEDDEDGFPLATANDESEEVSDLDSDVVIYSSTRSEQRRRKWTRPAMLLALLALLALAIALGVSSNNRSNTATILSSSTKAKDKVPAPKPASPPKKKGSDDTEALLTPYPTDNNVGGMTKSNMPTVGGTATVSTEVSAPPTVADRIESPTWRG